jgi:predicted flap endonuclease-1-like 5' DNA nuclease
VALLEASGGAGKHFLSLFSTMPEPWAFSATSRRADRFDAGKDADMSFTPNEIALLLVALLAGLVLGLMMSGRGKYKRLWREEQSAHHHAIRDRDARLNAANERIAELERQSAPIGPGTAAAVAGGVQGRDDLSRINGISQTQEVALNEAGYHRYGQIAALNGEQEATLEARLGLKPGTIAHEDWRGQAHDLERGEKPGLLSRLTGQA